jgi:putative transposase
MGPPKNDDEEDDQRWLVAGKRHAVLRPLIRKKRLSSTDVEEACIFLNISRPRFYQLLGRLRDNPEVATLVERQRGRRVGHGVFDADVEAAINAVITSRYLTREKTSISALTQDVALRCSQLGKKAPSRGAIAARITQLDLRKVIKAREGLKAANDKTRPIRGSLEAREPLQFIQMDHTLIDVIVVDEIERKPIQRPWLTIAIDIATRMIAGYYISLEPPSATSVAMALRHVVLSKDAWLLKYEERGSWPVSGIPETVHMDNAKEFHSRALTMGALEYGINLKYRPVKTPHFGGHIERLIGTIMKDIHGLPGTTFSNIAERGDYDSEKAAVMTLEELNQWLTRRIVGLYHNRVHASLGRPPLAVWNERIAARGNPLRMPLDHERFHLSFLPFEERLIRREGITLFNLHYWDDVLSVWAGRSKKKRRVRYDPRNMSHVFVEAPDGSYWTIRSRDLRRPTVTLWEIQAARKKLMEQGRSEVDEQMLFDAIGASRIIVDAASAATKAMRRHHQRTQTALNNARLLPMSRPLPASDAAEEEEKPFEDKIYRHEIEEWS